MLQLGDELEKGCQFVFAFNGMGSDLKIKEESIYNILDTVYITALVDHPIYHMQGRLNSQINKFIVTCLDYNHLKFLLGKYDENHFLIKAFMVPGGSESNFSNEESLEQFQKNRIINMLFTGSFRGIPKRGWLEYQNRSLVNLMNEICEFVLSHSCASVEEAFKIILREIKLRVF